MSQGSGHLKYLDFITNWYKKTFPVFQANVYLCRKLHVIDIPNKVFWNEIPTFMFRKMITKLLDWNEIPTRVLRNRHENSRKHRKHAWGTF